MMVMTRHVWTTQDENSKCNITTMTLTPPPPHHPHPAGSTTSTAARARCVCQFRQVAAGACSLRSHV
jgi:hypothetical protein